MSIIRVKSVVLVDIIYMMPDHPHILQDFFWQTDDVWPEIPRIHRFLNYWKDNIEAPINKVLVAHEAMRDWRHVDFMGYH